MPTAKSTLLGYSSLTSPNSARDHFNNIETGTGGDGDIYIGGGLDLTLEPEINLELDDSGILEIGLCDHAISIDIEDNFEFSTCKSLEIEL